MTVELYTPGKSQAVAHATTNSSGRFSIRRKLKKRTLYNAFATGVGDLPSCPAPPIGAPQGCLTATISFVVATPTVVARPKR